MTQDRDEPRHAPDPLAAGARICANCGAALTGRFCAECGQEDKPLDPPLRQVAAAFTAATFDWDSTTFRTLRALLAPGRLTAEYNAGRRAPYVHPGRVYLIASFAFLLAVTLAGDSIRVRVSMPDSGDVAGRALPGLHGTALEPLALRFERGLRRGEANPDWLRERWFRGFAWTMFAAMPLFALSLSLFELRRRAPYIHHLVFAVHFHAFAFFVMAASLALGKVVGVAALLLLLAVPAHLILAIRHVYAHGLVRASASGAAIGFLHLLVVALLALVATALTILLAG